MIQVLDSSGSPVTSPVAVSTDGTFMTGHLHAARSSDGFVLVQRRMFVDEPWTTGTMRLQSLVMGSDGSLGTWNDLQVYDQVYETYQDLCD